MPTVLTFTNKLVAQYKKAHQQNMDQSTANYYYCAYEDHITQRSLILEGDYKKVFIEIGSERKIGNSNDNSEFLIQAYIVKKAMENGFKLNIINITWLLLDAERKFTNSGHEFEHSRLDLLFCTEDKTKFIIVEVKATRELTKANNELSCYINQLGDEIDHANKVYNTAVNKENILGYIVWPRKTQQKGVQGKIKFPIIEYNKFTDSIELQQLILKNKISFDLYEP